MTDAAKPQPEASPSRLVWFFAAAAVAAWPLGILVTETFSIGSDGPGIALANLIGSTVTILVWFVSAVAVGAASWGKFAGFEKRFRLSIAACLLLVPVVAVWSSIPMQRYTLQVVNVDGPDISNVLVSYNNLRSSFGYQGGGTYAVKHYMTVPPRGLAEISWTDSNGEPRSAVLDLSTEVPRRYNNGVLTFEFDENGEVTVGFFIRK